MSERLVMTCPCCKRSLRVRSEYQGREVVCNRCEHRFVVRGGGAGGPAAGEDERDEALAVTRERLAELQREFGRLAGRYLDARNGLARARLRADELERQRDAVAREAEELRARYLALETAARENEGLLHARLDTARAEQIEAARREQELSRRLDVLLTQRRGRSELDLADRTGATNTSPGNGPDPAQLPPAGAGAAAAAEETAAPRDVLGPLESDLKLVAWDLVDPQASFSSDVS